MTWLGHENSCQLQSGLPCDCRLPGEDPCTCSPVNGLHPECPLHGPDSYQERPFERVLSDGDGDLG